MENASKALIIAGAILISILLISVGILIFNSTSGVSDSSVQAGEVLGSAAAQENAKIILSTMDIKDDAAFNNYIKTKYAGELTAEEVVELCTLVIERCKKITGQGYSTTETHITSVSSTTTSLVYWNTGNKKLYYQNFDNNKKYKMNLHQGADYDNNYSVRIVNAN